MGKKRFWNLSLRDHRGHATVPMAISNSMLAISSRSACGDSGSGQGTGAGRRCRPASARRRARCRQDQPLPSSERLRRVRLGIPRTLGTFRTPGICGSPASAATQHLRQPPPPAAPAIPAPAAPMEAPAHLTAPSRLPHPASSAAPSGRPGPGPGRLAPRGRPGRGAGRPGRWPAWSCCWPAWWEATWPPERCSCARLPAPLRCPRRTPRWRRRPGTGR
jgi:hypothetical protein